MWDNTELLTAIAGAGLGGLFLLIGSIMSQRSSIRLWHLQQRAAFYEEVLTQMARSIHGLQLKIQEAAQQQSGLSEIVRNDIERLKSSILSDEMWRTDARRGLFISSLIQSEANQVMVPLSKHSLTPQQQLKQITPLVNQLVKSMRRELDWSGRTLPMRIRLKLYAWWRRWQNDRATKRRRAQQQNTSTHIEP